MTAPGLLDLVGVQDMPAFVLVSARVSGLFLAAPLWSMAGMPKDSQRLVRQNAWASA